MEPNLRSLDLSSHNLSAHLLSSAHNLSLLSSTASPEMADNEARNMADQPPALGDNEAGEFHQLNSEHCSQESDHSTNYYFQPMSNLIVLTAQLNEAYCELESLSDERAQLKQQLKQKSFKVTELQKSHLQLQAQKTSYSVHSEYLPEQVLRLENRNRLTGSSGQPLTSSQRLTGSGGQQLTR